MEERDRLIEANWKLIQEHPDEIIPYAEDEFSYINCYTDESDVFLGISIATVECGEALNLSELGTLITATDMEAFAEKYTNILLACGEQVGPGTKWDNPQIYLLQRIW